MAEYAWRCSKCGKRIIRAIPIDDYDNEKDRQFHLEDGGKLERIIEFEGLVGATGGYDSVGGRGLWQN